MKYYIVSMITADGAEARANFLAESLENAIMQFHQTLASAYANDKVSEGLVFVINEKGGIEKSERIERVSETEGE